MSKIVLISGGARSGKSSLAEKMAMDSKKNTLYIATSIPFDDEMKERVRLHKERRPDGWGTVEKFRSFKQLKDDSEFTNRDMVILDCVTLMISNIILESDVDFENMEIDSMDRLEEAVSREVDEMMDLFKDSDKDFVIVTNEVGLGIVPENKLARLFRDIAGRINSRIAQESDEVYMVFMGIANRIK